MPDLPTWVPDSVKSMASVFHHGGDVRNRLLTNPRMQNVWCFLKRRSVAALAIEGCLGFQRPRDWDISEHIYTPQEVAMAALFAYSASELSMQRNVVERAKSDEFVERCRIAIQICGEACEYLPPSPQTAQALNAAKDYFDKIANAELGRQSPYIIADKGRNDHLRVRARAVAIETRRLYGSTLLKTVATIVSVGMDASVTAKSVENWCVDLPPP